MLRVIIGLHLALEKAIDDNPDYENLVANFFTPEVRNKLANLKYRKTVSEINTDGEELVQKCLAIRQEQVTA